MAVSNRSTSPWKARRACSRRARGVCGRFRAAPRDLRSTAAWSSGRAVSNWGRRTAAISAGSSAESTPCLPLLRKATSIITSSGRPDSFRRRRFRQIDGLNRLKQLALSPICWIADGRSGESARREARPPPAPCLRIPGRSSRRIRGSQSVGLLDRGGLGNTLVTASSRISAGSRRARSAARSIRPRTAANLSASPSIASPSMP